MMMIVRNLGFLPINKVPENFEVDLSRDLWTLAKGEENQGVSFDTLIVILLNLIGIRTRDREILQPGEFASRIESQADQNESMIPEGEHAAEKPSFREPLDVSNLGFFEGNRFFLHKGDHKKLFTYFKVFYVHRVQFIGLDEHHRRSLFDSYHPNSELKSKPEISEKTSKLADKKRTKLLGLSDVSQIK
jgi:hypothetical protein